MAHQAAYPAGLLVADQVGPVSACAVSFAAAGSRLAVARQASAFVCSLHAIVSGLVVVVIRVYSNHYAKYSIHNH